MRELPLPPELRAGMQFDGYRIVREIHASHRSHVYLAVDEEDGAQVAIKVPSVDVREDAAYLERFLLEEWIAAAHRQSARAQAARPQTRKRNFAYLVTEYVEGQTLAQWMLDHPKPDLETVRRLVEQVAAGLQAFHRHEMLHQDLRPENIMIDRDGTAKIIDFGSARVAGSTRCRGRVQPRSCWAPSSTRRPSTSSASRAAGNRTCFPWASSPTRCCRGGFPTAPACRKRGRARRSGD